MKKRTTRGETLEPDDPVLSVPCNYCGVVAGMRCISLGGLWVSPHRSRAETAGRVAPPTDVYLPVGEHDPAREELRQYAGERARFRGHLSRAHELLACVDSAHDACLPLSDSVAAVLQAVGSMIASGARLDALELARRKK